MKENWRVRDGMRYFIRLNIVSCIYAFVLFLQIEFMLNVYRISRLTGWERDFISNVGGFLTFAGIIAFPFLFALLIRKYLHNSFWSFFAVVLWFPYYYLMISGFASLFPMTDRGDIPGPGTGLIILLELMAYPVYLALVTFFSIVIKQGTKHSEIADER